MGHRESFRPQPNLGRRIRNVRVLKTKGRFDGFALCPQPTALPRESHRLSPPSFMF
jgi:hypothetical protein